MTDHTEGSALSGRLGAATAAFDLLASEIERGRPWPLGTVEPGEPEARWGPPEILAHLAEMLPYWLGEVERILEGAGAGTATTAGVAGGEPVPFGRTETDELRILTIARDRTLPLAELFSRIDGGVRRWQAWLARSEPRDLGLRGLHPRRGEITVGEILERFVVGHFEEHVEQLTEAIARPR